MTQSGAGEGHGDPGGPVFAVIMAISVCHCINDMLQALLPAIYPILKTDLGLNFSQIGLVTLTYQMTASILQPLVGLYADRRPTPLALPSGPMLTLGGLALLSAAHNFPMLLAGAALLGMGSSIFHPESSRVAAMASGGRRGLAQALFQVGGNAGQALGPLAAALVVVRWGQTSLAFFALLALLACAILWRVAVWRREHGLARLRRGGALAGQIVLPRGKALRALGILLALIFSKYFYLASLNSYFTFYLIHRFSVSVPEAQLHLALFLAAVAAGTVAGGPLGDRFGRKGVIWFSILGALPFTLLLPHVNLAWTGPLTVCIGLILSSAFPAIVVYAQELFPGKVGAMAGLFFGLAFGLGGIGAAVLGRLADATSIERVYQLCAYLPALGLLAAFLPQVERVRRRRA
ncbi:MAG: MFS transporter [Desulfovibrionaceae bacterium]|nr:MFS transporter [Desulfovibrionaceae bacterium]MBF0513353.1 MFS transporter [Desulfovibrionaceae bacterium]